MHDPRPRRRPIQGGSVRQSSMQGPSDEGPMPHAGRAALALAPIRGSSAYGCIGEIDRMNRRTLSLAIAVAMFPALAWAQDAQPAATTPASNQPASKPATLDTVTVTARKREETLQEVPVAVTAFTAEALDKLGVDDLSDLDTQVPNLTIYAARGSNSTITAYIRGVGQSDPLWGVDPGVGLYLDDVYIARPQGGLLDVFDVERVEVLRGPQGTLYGKNTVGGAIKYISRPLTTDVT